MGKKPKKQKAKPVVVPVAPVTPEDEVIKKTGDEQRRRIAAQQGRGQSVTSERMATILG